MSAESPHRRPIRVAIVGTGAIARGSHLPALTALAAEQPLEIVGGRCERRLRRGVLRGRGHRPSAGWAPEPSAVTA
jgi:hypothetical protein